MTSKGKGPTFFDEPRVMYLRGERGRIDEHLVIGETTRSWLTGWQWKYWKYSKAGKTTTSKEEYELYLWVRRNIDGILNHLEFNTEGCVVKQIADLIGYAEKPQEPRR